MQNIVTLTNTSIKKNYPDYIVTIKLNFICHYVIWLGTINQELRTNMLAHA